MMKAAILTAASKLRELVVSGCDTTPILEPAEHPLDQVAQL
jgi:hypothetical protein